MPRATPKPFIPARNDPPPRFRSPAPDTPPNAPTTPQLPCPHEKQTDRRRRTRAALGRGGLRRIPKAFVALAAAGAGGDRARPARQGPRRRARDRGRGRAGARGAAEERVRGGVGRARAVVDFRAV